MHELANNLIGIGNQEMNQKRCAFFRKQQHSLGNRFSLRAMKNCKISLWNQLVRPPRIELGLRVPETLVISLSLRARANFSITGVKFSQRTTGPRRSRPSPFRRE